MGAVEERAKRTNLQKILLGMIAVADAMDEASASGHMSVVMRRMGLAPKMRELESIERAQKRLKEKGFIKTEKGKLRLTSEGKHKLLILEPKFFAPHKPRNWDKRWRLIVFDIPEYRRSLRKKLCRIFSKIGFVRLQRSVWLYPYDCEDLIILLKADFHIGHDLLYLVVNALENEMPYRKYFNLPIRESSRSDKFL